MTLQGYPCTLMISLAAAEDGRRPALVHHIARLGMLAVVLLLLAACTGGGSDTGSAEPTRGTRPSAESSVTGGNLASFARQKLEWSGCRDGFECTTMRVPLDYENPGGEQISLALVRLPAADQKRRVGSLLVNPGGPGGSGVDYAKAARQTITSRVRKRFDIVGFDPRGVGKSTPVECLTDQELDEFFAADATPDSAEEQDALVADARAFATSCQRRSGTLLPYVSTQDAARDMDLMRAVLGDEKLSYLGKSYGTLLGATYAELFPQRVRAAVLDGAIDPSLPGEEVSLAQAEGFDQALQAFADDCLGRGDCPLSGDVNNAVTQVRSLLERTDEQPLEGDGEREVTQSLAVLGVAAALYDESNGWPALRLGLRRAQDGDGAVLLFLADFYTDRKRDGTYRTNQNEAIYAVNCIDRPEGKRVAGYEADAREFAARAPVFGPYLAWGSLPCAYWSVAPKDTPHEIRAAGSAPILVVGTLRDPATPYQWAEALANQLDAGLLLTYDGDGHTAYARGSSCIDKAVERYLITTEPPSSDRVCR